MPFNLLLLPLLGGYIFISRWHVTRFDSTRYTGERLLFHSATAGVVFLLAAFVVTRAAVLWQPGFYSTWREAVPFAYAGTSFLAFLLGALIWIPANWFLDREQQALLAVEQWGDFLEMLLNRSITETRQISLTLASGKVYVGFVTTAFDPSFPRKYLMLMPTLSGYRDSTTKEVFFTNDYATVYGELLEGDETDLMRIADQFQLVIPVSEVVSANLFDPDIYEMFATSSAPADSLRP
jgi:hypothetical protein